MNKGVQILLARMDSNPEEFDYDGWLAKWSRLYDRYSECLTAEEREAIAAKRLEILREVFTNSVMGQLLGIAGPIRELTPEQEEYIDAMTAWRETLAKSRYKDTGVE